MLRIYRPVRTRRITQNFNANEACVNFNTGKVVGKRKGKCPNGFQDFYKGVGLLGHNGIDMAALKGEIVRHNCNFRGRVRTEIDSRDGLGIDVHSLEPLKIEGTYLLEMGTRNIRVALIQSELNKRSINSGIVDGIFGPRTHGAVTKFQEERRLQLDGIVGENVFSHLFGQRKIYIKARFWHNLKFLVGDGDIVELGTPIAEADSTGASSGHHVHFGIKFVEMTNNEQQKPHERYYSIYKDNGYVGAIDPKYYMTFEVHVLTLIKGLENIERLIVKARRHATFLTSILKNLREFYGLVGGRIGDWFKFDKKLT